MSDTRSQSWTWRFDHPPSVVWPLMADTQRFNEAAALPRHTIEEVTQSDGSVRFFARARIGPFRLRWEDMPVNWVTGEWLEHRRLFFNGPFRSLTAHIRLEPSAQGTDLHYKVTVEPRNFIGRLLLATRFFPATEKNFSRLAREANSYLSGVVEQPFAYQAPNPSPEQKVRVQSIVEAIEATPNGHGLARRLADFILDSQEVDLWKLRPIALARSWGSKPVPVVELCLQAVRSGMLEMRWDLLCPRCRVAKSWSVGLDQLPKGAHCSSCNIDYDRDFARNVEASFHPAPGVRQIESGEYCMWGPMSVPHVKAQVRLMPGEVREISASLPPGPYRLRTLEPGPETSIDWPGGGFPTLSLMGDQVKAGKNAPVGALRLENRTERPLTAIIEDRRWIEDVLTGERLTALQGFRDLFSDDVLRPGDEVAVARVALLFSDLQGSTALYQKIGDAQAYHLVRDHFALLTECVRAHEGAVVKTIGDAVMAAFSNTNHAVSAALDILKRIDDFNRAHVSELQDGSAIVIKLGVHVGPAIIVTLNDRLDYFGSTVNLAARLQAMAKGGQVVLSTAAMAEPEVDDLVSGLRHKSSYEELKGFQEKILIHRYAI